MFNIVGIIAEAIRYGAAFLYGSTGEIIIEKSGHLNLGIPGIMCMGAIGGCMGANIATKAGSGAFGVILATIFFAMLMAGMMGAVYPYFFISNRGSSRERRFVVRDHGS